MRCKLLAFILALLALGSLAGAAPPQHVKATLLADVKQIVPGKPFHLGVLVEIDPGWHIYWLNPGDSGLPTKIKLDLPKGLTAGDVQFPTPIKIVDPGNINVYGYTDKVMFIAMVTPDKSLAPGEADLSAKVSYLVCKDICVPGHATPSLTLPTGAATENAERANKELFERWTSQIPLPPDKNFTQSIAPDGHTVHITFPLGVFASAPQVFPGPNDDVEVDSKVVDKGMTPGAVGPHDFDITLRIQPLAGRLMPAVILPVVIGYDYMGHRRRGIITQIDLSKLIPADSKPPHG